MIVAGRTTNRDGAAICAVTGETVTLNEPHYYVMLWKPTLGRHQSPEYAHLVVVDGTLGELDKWIE